jgi:hypothetical protein
MPTGPFFATLDKDVRTRPLSLAGTKGYDVRGANVTGNISRWVGVFYTHVVYENVHASVAKVFDTIIDGMCYY